MGELFDDFDPRQTMRLFEECGINWRKDFVLDNEFVDMLSSAQALKVLEEMGEPAEGTSEEVKEMIIDKAKPGFIPSLLMEYISEEE